MHGLVVDNRCDSGDPLAIGIFTRFSWWLNPYIAGRCYYSDSGQNHPGTQTIIAIPIRRAISATYLTNPAAQMHKE
jgi:hypothetical protein